MRLKGAEYRKRLREFSYSTIALISEVMGMPEEIYEKGREITTNSELTEDQVVEQLKKLLEENKDR